MCVAAFISQKALKEAAGRFKLDTEARDYYRVLLEDIIPVVRKRQGKPEAFTLNWKATQSVGGRALASFNVRGERIERNQLWKDAFGAQHCLVFADGFFDKEEVGRKRRYHYFVRNDGAPLAMAGMWKHYKDEDYEGDILTIITTEPNADVADIHDRMPLTLPESAWDVWLNIEDRQTLLKLVKTPEEGQLKHWRITDDLFKRTLPNDYSLLDVKETVEPSQGELF